MDDVGIDVGGAERVEVAAAVESVDVGHHSSGAVDGGPSVSKKLLRPTAELVTGPRVGGNLLDGVTVADPVEMGAPEVVVDDGEGPASSSDLADEGVVVRFGGGTATGGRKDRLEAGRGKSLVEGDRLGPSRVEKGCGGSGGCRVFGLHEDK